MESKEKPQLFWLPSVVVDSLEGFHLRSSGRASCSKNFSGISWTRYPVSEL